MLQDNSHTVNDISAESLENILDRDPDEVKKRLDEAITTNGKDLDSYNLRIDVDLDILKRPTLFLFF